MRLKRVLFWAAVAGTSILANAGMELLADHLPSEGLGRLVAYLHRGPSAGSAA